MRPQPGGWHPLKTVAVAPAWRRRGVARALGDFVVPGGPRPLFGSCLASMAAFYERFGGAAAADPPRRLRLERAVVNLRGAGSLHPRPRYPAPRVRSRAMLR